MKNPVCDEVLLSNSTGSETKDLYSWYIANCVFNAVLSITAIIFNSVTLQALRKTSSLPKPLKTLLLSLAVSDLGVGLLVEPFYFGLLVNWVQRKSLSGAKCTVFLLITFLFAAASFLGVTALSVDRFLAIHLHLRYLELVTHKRVVAAVISIWVFSAFLSLFSLQVSTNITYVVLGVVAFVCITLSAMLYYKIYLAVRRHRNQIHALQVQQVVDNDEVTNFARLRKSALGTFYVYLIFLFCYLPQACSFFVYTIPPLSTVAKVSSISSTTLVFLNSSLNPVIYCWKMRNVRHAMMVILRNIFPSYN